MRAARVVEKGRVEFVEVPEPQPGPGQVVIRMLQCGICGSDLHAYRGEWSTDSKIGHEICGIVEELGPGVENVREGDRVCAECFGHCGHCAFCRAGDYNLCTDVSWTGWQDHGALAERTIYPADACFVVPDGFTDSEAMMVEPLAVSFRAVVRCGNVEGSTVAVIGAGTIGLLCVAAARARGAAHVLAIAKRDHQVHFARRLGADLIAQTGKARPADVLSEAGLDPHVDACIDTVAVGTSFSTCLGLVRRQGRAVVVAGVTRPLLSALGPLVGREMTITGSQCYAVTEGRPDFEWAIALIRDGVVDVAPLVTHVLPFDQVDEAFGIANGKECGSVKVGVRIAD
jgi:threonine dehydrogenase-like Zn-dependent dehydrogenase